MAYNSYLEVRRILAQLDFKVYSDDEKRDDKLPFGLIKSYKTHTYNSADKTCRIIEVDYYLEVMACNNLEAERLSSEAEDKLYHEKSDKILVVKVEQIEGGKKLDEGLHKATMRIRTKRFK